MPSLAWAETVLTMEPPEPRVSLRQKPWSPSAAMGKEQEASQEAGVLELGERCLVLVVLQQLEQVFCVEVGHSVSEVRAVKASEALEVAHEQVQVSWDSQ